MRFVHPWVLALAWTPLLFGLWCVWMRLGKLRKRERFAAAPLLARLSPPEDAPGFALQIALLIPALTLLIVACARPQWGEQAVTVHSRGHQLMLLVDVSRSMLATDVRPNRLERVRADLHDLVDALEGDRAGVIAFRNGGVLLCPLTRDVGFLKHTIDALDINSAPAGPTDIGVGIRTALNALDTSLGDHSAILLFSDFEDLADDALDAARAAAEHGVPIFTIGIGDTQGAPVPDGSGGILQFEGEDVISRFDPATLRAVAEISGGVFIPLGRAGAIQGTLGAVYREHMRRVAERERIETLEQRHVDRFPLFLIPAVLLLCGVVGSSTGRPITRSDGRRRSSTPPSAAAVLPVLLAFASAISLGSSPAPSFDPPRTREAAIALAREALQMLEAGNDREAAAAFLLAAEVLDGDRAAQALFNAAVALTRDGDIKAAITILESLVQTENRISLPAARLLGNLHHAASEATDDDPNSLVEHLEQAARAFQRALRQAPEDASLRQALASVLEVLPSARLEARIDRVLREHGDKPPENLLDRMLSAQRELAAKASDAQSVEAPEAISLAEDAAALQRDNRDLWIALKRALTSHPQLADDPQSQARIAQHIEALRDAMDDTSEQLRDLEAGTDLRAKQLARDVYDLWQPLAPPPLLIEAGILAQTNAMRRPPPPPTDNPAEWQHEALDIMNGFRERFPHWADTLADQAAQMPDATPALEPEARAEIEKLVGEALTLQQAAFDNLVSGTSARSIQQAALENLKRIRELLPKPPPEEPPPQPPPDNDEDSPPPETDATPPETTPPEEPRQKDEPQPADSPQELPEDIETQLERALQREREHADDQRRRARETPAPRDMRDW